MVGKTEVKKIKSFWYGDVVIPDRYDPYLIHHKDIKNLLWLYYECTDLDKEDRVYDYDRATVILASNYKQLEEKVNRFIERYKKKYFIYTIPVFTYWAEIPDTASLVELEYSDPVFGRTYGECYRRLYNEGRINVDGLHYFELKEPVEPLIKLPEKKDKPKYVKLLLLVERNKQSFNKLAHNNVIVFHHHRYINLREVRWGVYIEPEDSYNYSDFIYLDVIEDSKDRIYDILDAIEIKKRYLRNQIIYPIDTRYKVLYSADWFSLWKKILAYYKEHKEREFSDINIYIGNIGTMKMKMSTLHFAELFCYRGELL